jgi:hypothetical protein
MSDRYIPHQPNRFQKPLLAAAFIALTLMTAFGAYRFANPPIRASLIAFSITSAEEVSIKYSIDRRDPKEVLVCTLVAKDMDKTIVGQIEIQIPATAAKSIEMVSEVPTRVRAVTAAVVRCIS